MPWLEYTIALPGGQNPAGQMLGQIRPKGAKVCSLASESAEKMIIESGAVREQAVEGYRGGKRRWHLEAAEVAVHVCMQVEAPFAGQLHHRRSYNGFSV